MAKISAGGAHEIARWTRAGRKGFEHGWSLLLTSDGRLLRKWSRDEGWKAYKRGQTLDTAAAQACMFGFERSWS